MDYTIDNGDYYKKSTISLNNKTDILARLIDEGKEFIDNDFNLNASNGMKLKGNEYGFDGVRSLMSCPLIFQNNIIGIVNVKSYIIDAFNSNDFEILKILSSYISIALHNSMQSQKVIDTNHKLKELTEKDGLTKVYNRYSLNTNIKRILRRGKKFNKPYSVIMIDVDFFKEYNDNYGHLAGDKCLVEVSHVLKKTFSKEKSYIYRYGGDEFLVILLNVTPEESIEIADSVRNEISNLSIEHLYSKCDNVITLTLGVATITQEIQEYENVFALADKALYIAKNRGRNNVKQIIHE
jgi:diguanylate cyclase (GGDEF)-like protein